MKKRDKILISLVLAIIFIVTQISCGGATTRRKFVGEISEESFLTKEEALVAYVQDEYCVENGEIYEFDSYETIEGLTVGELHSLGFSNSSEIDGERVVVTFKSQNGIFYKTETYLLEENEEYKYCSVVPWEDTPLNKAYYNFIVDQTQYQNVTVNLTSSAVFNYKGYRTTVKSDLKVFYTQDGVYISFETTEFSVGESHSQFVEFWALVEGEEFRVYTNDKNGSFTEITEDVLPILNNSAENLTPLGILNEYDHTIFMYRDSGFYLKETVKDELKTRFLKEVFGTEEGEVYAINTDVEIHDGKILTITETANAMSGSVTLSNVSTAVYSNYGKTEVDIPEEILQMQNQGEEE